LRAALDSRAATVAELPPGTPVRVLAASGRSFRVRSADGLAGYLGEADLGEAVAGRPRPGPSGTGPAVSPR
jgi:hypothetical protein